MPYTPPAVAPAPTFILPNNQPVDESCIRPWPQDSTQVHKLPTVNNIATTLPPLQSASPTKVIQLPSEPVSPKTKPPSSLSTSPLKNHVKPKSIAIPSPIITQTELLTLGPKGDLNTNGTAADFMSNNGQTPAPRVDIIDATPPAMIRKKSGEVVRSSLKKAGGSPRVAKSAPSTPTCPKFVHFDTKLEHVRLFLQAETPTAVSADPSPSDEKNGEDGYFASASKKPALALSLPNFPSVVTSRQVNPVFVEYIILSDDKRHLQGRISVQNLAFSKWVAVRFTFDFWQTVSEVSAEYVESVPNSNSDRFSFSVKLEDMLVNIDKRTMYLAVRYTCNGQEYWDNNNGMNYQVEFRRIKEHKQHRRSATTTTNTWPIKSSTNFTQIEELKKELNKLNEEEYGSPPSVSSGPQFAPLNIQLPLKKRGPITKSFTDPTKQTEDFSAKSPRAPRPDIPTVQLNPYFTDRPMFSDNYHVSPSHYFPSSFVEGLPATNAQLPTPDEEDTPKRPQSPGRLSKSSRSTSPISIPSGNGKPAINSTSYYDFVDRYCFYNGSNAGSPRSGRQSPSGFPQNGYKSNPYASSPPATAIRG